MAEPDKKIELELAVRDSVSATLKVIAANLDSINSKVSRGGNLIQESADTLHQVATHSGAVGEQAKQSTKSLLNLGDTIKTLTAFVTTGPIAIAAGVAVTVKLLTDQLDRVATHRLALRRMAEDSGFSEGRISILRRYGSRMGFDPEQTDKNIKHIGASFKELLTETTGAELFRNLADVGEPELAKSLLKETQKGGTIDLAFEKAAARYDELIKKGDTAQAAKVAWAMGVPESFLKDYRENAKGLVPAYEMSGDAAEAWGKRMAFVHASYDTLWLGTMGAFIRTLVVGEKAIGKLKHLFRHRIARPDVTDPAERKKLGLLPLSADELESVKTTKQDSTSVQKEIADIIRRLYEKGKATPGRAEGGPVLPGRSYMVGERGPELLASGGRVSIVGAGGRELMRPADTGQVYRFEDTDYGEGGNIARRKMQEDERYGRSAAQAEIDNEKYFEGVYARSAAIAPSGIGWEKWRRSTAIEDTTKYAKYDPQTGAQIRAGPIMPKQWFDDKSDPRATLDATMADPSTDFGKAQLQAAVFFKNVPQGVKTTADSNGIDQFKMSRTQQLEVR